MNNLNVSMLAAAVALVLGAASASAGETTRVEETRTTTDAHGNTVTSTRVKFEDYDSDADGIIVKSEIPAGSTFSTVWTQYDIDRDLRITPVEFRKWTVVDADGQRVQQTTVSTDARGNTTTTTTTRFEDLDADADGIIVKSEIPSASPFATVWTKYDTDGDLRITPVEYQPYAVAGRDVRSVEKHTSHVRDADGSTTRLTTTTKVGFEDWDADSDGVLVTSEIPADSRFKTVWVDYDADRNRTISRDEFDAWIVLYQSDDEEAE
jgi:hypothetical protein